jgi:hypothetical protein
MSSTKKQQEILNSFKDNLLEKVRKSILKQKECYLAIVSLPHKNEDGESVVHRDNLNMLNLMELYRQEANVWWNQLSNEEQNLLWKEFPNWHLNFRNSNQ